MENRTLTIRARVSKREKDLILQRMTQAGITNLSAYAREIMINGQVTIKDFTEIKGVTAQLGKIGSNINQVAKRANESRSVSYEDIRSLMKMLERIHRLLGRELGKLLN